MRAADILRRVCEAIDAHQWHELAPLLDEHFECHYVHTGESFDRDVWIALNANYPDFDRLVIEDLVGDDRCAAVPLCRCAAVRCHVTARRGDGVAHFAVATIVARTPGFAPGVGCAGPPPWTAAARPPRLSRI